MIAINYSTARNNLKDYCDQVCNGETILVTRKENKDVVFISLNEYNQMQKELRNAKYLAKIERGFKQIESGRGQEHELIEDENDEEDLV